MSKLIKKADRFVFNLFKDKLPNTFLYHNYTHTERVLKNVNEILENTETTPNEKNALQLAALFHDTGYLRTREGHEEESVKIATEFLKKENIDKDIIDVANKLILATKFDKQPDSKIEAIIKDADTAHFGKKYFTEASEFLRKELEIQNIASYSPSEWSEINFKMLTKDHIFFSDYALKNWQTRKEKNLLKLIKNKVKKKKKLKIEKIKAKYKAQYKDESSDRGVQTFYRVTLKNHLKLSDIADTKANILLSVNAIIISLVLSNLISKLDNPSNNYLIVPTIIFILFSVASMILSILATRPNITRAEFTEEDVKNKKVNLAFFGNFNQLDLKVYKLALKELLKDKDYLYGTLAEDLYFLGKVLDRKYKILRITYTIFMSGIIISLIAFAISFQITNPR